MASHHRASHTLLLLCALSLCVELVRGGTSFLSPVQRPQGKERKPPRAGRRDAGDPEVPPIQDDGHFLVSAPFELSVSLSDAEYEKYGSVLKKVLLNLFSSTPLE